MDVTQHALGGCDACRSSYWNTEVTLKGKGERTPNLGVKDAR